MPPKPRATRLLALKRAAPALAVEHRDLYRRPLDADGTRRASTPSILDPPRAGRGRAGRAARRLNRARGSLMSAAIPRPSRAMPRLLVDGGYALDWVRPVGQFRWSTHVELAACFSR